MCRTGYLVSEHEFGTAEKIIGLEVAVDGLFKDAPMAP
jgi:hypothetical protein